MQSNAFSALYANRKVSILRPVEHCECVSRVKMEIDARGSSYLKLIVNLCDIETYRTQGHGISTSYAGRTRDDFGKLSRVNTVEHLISTMFEFED